MPIPILETIQGQGTEPMLPVPGPTETSEEKEARLSKKEKEKRIARVKDFWAEANVDEHEYQTRRDKSFNFYKSKQWNQTDIDDLKAQGRPYLTFNYIKSIIRNASGHQRQNRQQVQVLERRGGLALLATAFSAAIKYCEDISDAVWAKSFAFFYGIIGGKSYIGLDIDYLSDPINGDLVIRSEDPEGIIEDPANKDYDMNKGRFVFRYAWKDKEELELMFPELKETAFTLVGKDDVRTTKDTGDTYRGEGVSDTGPVPDKTAYRLKECWWRSYERRFFVIEENSLAIKEFTKKKDTEGYIAEQNQAIINIQQANIMALASGGQQIPAPPQRQFQVIERTVAILNLTTLLGDYPVQDMKNPLKKAKRFPIIRFCPDWILGYPKGEVEDLIAPQEEANKRESQLLHHLNQSANSGYMVEEGALGKVGCSSLEDLKISGSKPGVIIVYAKGSQKPDRLTPVGISDGHLTLAQKATETIKRISGFNPDMLGEVSDPNISGYALNQRKMSGLVTAEPIFDNWRYTEKILGETLLEIIREMDIISSEELAFVMKDNPKINIDELMTAFKDRANGKYGVVVSLSPYADTAKIENMRLMGEMMQAGIPIPPQVIIKESRLSESSKEEIIQSLTQIPGPVG